MARFQLTQAMQINHQRIKAGGTIADSVGGSISGDVIWTGLNAQTVNPCMVPLDASATTMKNGSQYANAPLPRIDGVNSIQG